MNAGGKGGRGRSQGEAGNSEDVKDGEAGR